MSAFDPLRTLGGLGLLSPLGGEIRVQPCRVDNHPIAPKSVASSVSSAFATCASHSRVLQVRERGQGMMLEKQMVVMVHPVLPIN